MNAPRLATLERIEVDESRSALTARGRPRSGLRVRQPADRPAVPDGAEALVVDCDRSYRDRVLGPCLLAMGFRRVHAATDTGSAERQLARHPGVAVVVTSAVLRRGEDGMAVCRMARNASIPVVLLTSFDLADDRADHLADRVVYRKEASVFATVTAVCHAAAGRAMSG